ncbi:MAG TPA: glycoside hydrolase family 65 protein, partial [Gammaproteobacteria bacterium]|nr:glycoside hydrolase family 65 protein [Gammaproteobacteria bacterium]
MSEWRLEYRDYVPEQQGLRESLCALGNGYFVTRAAATDVEAGEVHYPGTYVAGAYNRLTSRVQGREIENESLVNCPNWLPLAIRIEDGDWLHPDHCEVLDYRQELDIARGLLVRRFRYRDGEGRVTACRERRLVSMASCHLAATELTVTPENWSG